MTGIEIEAELGSSPGDQRLKAHGPKCWAVHLVSKAKRTRTTIKIPIMDICLTFRGFSGRPSIRVSKSQRDGKVANLRLFDD